MPRALAASSALRRSREAIAVTSIQSLFCIAGIAFLIAIPAVLRIPQRTFLPIPGILEARAAEDAGNGAAEDEKICSERPIREVLHVVHFDRGGIGVAAAVYLPQACDTRAHGRTEGKKLRIEQLAVVVRERTRAHQTKVAAHHVPDLRQLVNAVTPEKRAHHG